MNLCQLGFFGDKQQKPTLVNLSKKGYLGKDVEQQEKKKKNLREPNAEVARE